MRNRTIGAFVASASGKASNLRACRIEKWLRDRLVELLERGLLPGCLWDLLLMSHRYLVHHIAIAIAIAMLLVLS